MDKANTIIHIGYPKTASTWFQREFFPRVENGLYIDRFLLLRKHIIDPSPFEFDAFKTKKIICSNLPKNKILLLSDEAFLGGNEYFVKEYALRLKNIFEKPKILIIIRNQKTILASKYSQYLKANGGTFRFKKYIYRENDFFRTDNILFDHLSLLKYDKVISYYKGLFGNDNVIIILFEDFTSNPALFSQNLAKRLNFVVNTNDISYSKRNEGLRRGMVPIARFINRFTSKNRFEKHYFFHIPFWYYISIRVINRLNKLPIFGKNIRPEMFLSKADCNKLYDIFKESNRKLIEEHGLKDIEKYGYPL